MHDNPTSAPPADPVTLEIVRYALQGVVDEMTVTLVRAAYSVNIKTRFDMSCAVFDRECRLLAQSEKICQPGFVGALVMFAQKIRESYGENRLRPGDVLVVNDPFLWATHLPDVALFTPLFAGDGSKPYAYLMCIAHHSDMGGRAPGGYVGDTTEVYQEGLIIPPVLLVKEGAMDQEILDFIVANVRTKADNIGDFTAQIASLRTGQMRLEELQQRYGREALETYTDALLDQAEKRFAHALSVIPEGEYFGEDWLDDDGITDEPVHLAVRLEVGGGKIVVDLSPSASQVRGPFNCTPAQAYSKAFYAIKAMVDPDGPVNGGCYRLVELIAPEGSVCNPRRPAAVAMGWETSNRVLESTLLALAEAMPERALAQCKRTIGVTGYGGMNPATGEPYAFFEAIGGGYGARAGKDGIDGIQPHTQNTADAEVEELEASFPVEVRCFQLIPDSEGAGRLRGGLGIRKELVFRGHEVNWSAPADGKRFRPRGVHGGGQAQGLRYVMARGQQDERIIDSKTTVRVAPDKSVCIETPGGGGYGRAAERDPQAVLRDVRQGKVSEARALSVYCVALQRDAAGRLAVDEAGTRALRAAAGEAAAVDTRPAAAKQDTEVQA
ncbi:MAG: hydantoinase B/oxoprolinase family protein [Lautropia sp.]